MLIVVKGGNISIHFSLLLGMLGKCFVKGFLKEEMSEVEVTANTHNLGNSAV